MARKAAAKAKGAEAAPVEERGSAEPAAPVLSLDEILGQERALGVLRSAIGSGRVHHAWIFGGPVGVGKFSTAVALAAVLLDPTTGPDLSGRIAPEADSPVQRMIRERRHPDLHVVTKELAKVSRDKAVRDSKQRVIPLEVLREFLIEPAARTRVLGGESLAGKVFVVDEAELMRQDAQDALLKTLEEPPAGSVIILVTSSEDRLSPTVRSRCQRVAFAPLDERAMQAWLKRYLEAAGGGGAPALSAAQREWVLRFAAGSPGAAVAAIENELYRWEEALGPLLAELDAGRFPVQLGGVMHKLVDERAAAWVKRNPEASKEAANHLWSRRLFAFLAEHYRQGLRQAVGGRGASARAGGAERRMRAIDLIADAERQVGTNVNAAQVMENLAAQLAVEQ